MRYRSVLRAGEALIRTNGFLSVNHIAEIQAGIVGNDAGLRAMPGTALVNDRSGEVVYSRAFIRSLTGTAVPDGY